ncbi:hypothetical protein BDZ45DRAFT_271029 [Acephala macrosclerotiorum]|nr:hypothetical protein BDZ45DRAFT_271029 [Acephala macrosclerotiorum]
MHGGQRVGQEQESSGGESASRTLSGAAGSMRWDGWIDACEDCKSLQFSKSSSCLAWAGILALRVRRYVPSRGDGFSGREGTAAGDRRDFYRRMGIGRAGHSGHSGASQPGCAVCGPGWVGSTSTVSRPLNGAYWASHHHHQKSEQASQALRSGAGKSSGQPVWNVGRTDARKPSATDCACISPPKLVEH